jgi:hypothetical protein
MLQFMADNWGYLFIAFWLIVIVGQRVYERVPGWLDDLHIQRAIWRKRREGK